MSVLQKALDNEWYMKPIGEVVGMVGTELLGTPYVGWTLERDLNREYCYVSMDRLDCVTLFETSLGFARMLKRWDRDVRILAGPNARIRRPLPGDLVSEVAWTRYRSGKPGDYSTRLHYTMDWMDDNAKKKVVKNVTPSLKGAIPFEKDIHFMSQHRNLYRQLVTNDSLFKRIQEMEKHVNSLKMSYLPKDQISKNEVNLRSGDILGWVTSQDGMDIAHTGLVIRKGERAHFLHASSTEKKVILDDRLASIARRVAAYQGIMVVRPVELP